MTQTSKRPTKTHRSPIRIDIEAYYNEEVGSLYIIYVGEAVGEVYIYRNDNAIGYDSELNTSFQISAPGLYRIEIITETWTATGYIQI